MRCPSPLRPWLLAVAVAAVAAAAAWTPTAHAAAVPLSASFTVAPEQPAPGEVVTLHSTTTPTATSGRTYDWDLDADGQFDDAAGETVTTSFAADGDYEVRLRARQSGATTQESIAVRRISVRSPGSTTPPPEPPPPPPPPADDQPAPPAANQPPEARLALGCHLLTGGMVLCDGTFTRDGDDHTFDASPSRDADGSIVKYEWDLDGNGTWDVDGGADPKLVRTYKHMIGQSNERHVRVRVTDDRGATDTAEMTLRILPPACQPRVEDGLLVATSTCLRPRKAGALTRWRSTAPVTINGIVLLPGPGGVTITTGGARTRIESPDAKVLVQVKQATAQLTHGRIDWEVDGASVTGVVLRDAKLNGLRITGLPTPPTLKAGNASDVAMHVALPQDFGGASSKQPIVSHLGGAQAASDTPLRFEVPQAALGPIGLQSLVVAYDGEGLWEIAASVAVPAPIPVTASGGAGVRDGAFESAWGEVSFKDMGGLALGTVFLQRVKFTVEVAPKKSKCVRETGVEKVDMKAQLERIGIPADPWPADWPRYWYVDHGMPTFALCGEIELTAGPSVAGAAAIGVDAGLGLATYDDRPFVVNAHGELRVVEIPLAEADFKLYGDGYVSLHGGFHWEPFEGIASVDGLLKFEMWAPKFNAEAYVEACLEFVDLCAGANGLISSRGVALCLHVSVLGATWRPGVGWLWGETFPDLYFSGCDVGKYREHIGHAAVSDPATTEPPTARAAQAQVLRPGARTTIDLPAGLPGATFVAQGDTAAPDVTLIGPKGERIASPAVGKALQEPGVLGFRYPQGKRTQFAVAKPSAGRWTVVVGPGSAAVTSLKSAEGLEPPEVHATVRGTGRHRTIAYRIAERPGQKVTFVERGRAAGGVIGVARGGSGTLPFTPAAGTAGRREVVAIVEQDGLVRDELAVTTYVAPKPARAGRVRHVRVVRRGGRLLVSWQRARGAARHEVRVALADGRRLLLRTPRTRAVVAHVPARLHGSVSVRGLRPAARDGRATRVRV